MVQCSPGVNLLLGDNGEGKTNILEGISYLCIAKSFFAANDAIVMKIGERGFKASGTLMSDGGTEYDLRVDYD